jgi:hypothetical protein
MKLHTYAFLAAAAACGLASAQTTAYTTPVGYTTQSILAGQFNVFGLNVHQPSVASGVIDASDADSVTDTQVNFTTTLTAGLSYILEINTGSGAGTIQEVTAWTGSELSLSADLTSIITNGVTTYTLRPAATVGSVFGAANSAGLLASPNADPAEADVISIPDGAGGFIQVFYSSADGFTGWFDTVNFADATNLPLIYADGFLLQRRGITNLSLVVSGEVKKTPTIISVDQPFTYIGSVYPAGSTLGTSGLSASVLPSANADPAEADVLYMPDGTGGYLQYFYSTAEGFTGWFDTVNFADSSAVELTPGVLVQRRAPSAYSALISPPPSYSSL